MGSDNLEHATEHTAAIPAQAAENAAQDVQQAVTNVTEAAGELPEGAMHETLTSIKDVLVGVERELKRSNDRAEAVKTTEEETAAKAAENAEAAAAPAVEVAKPAPPERRVRRGMRKVKRRGE